MLRQIWTTLNATGGKHLTSEFSIQRACSFKKKKKLNYNDCSCCPLSPLLAFVQTWLDEYSEDFRDPPLHAALRLLLDHLRISSAVHDNMRTQPNFCSLAAQAKALLMRFRKEGDPP